MAATPGLDQPLPYTGCDQRAKPLRIAFQNVGCKLNRCELEGLMDGFGRRGDQIVSFHEPADVYVVNTCTVTSSGDADSRKAVRRARRLNPEATVVATGCYAQRRPAELTESGADLVVGNSNKAALPGLLAAHLRGEAAPIVDPAQRPQTTQFLTVEGPVRSGRTRGMLEIQDGCDEHCTYCVIPSVRGASVSRPPGEVVEQASRMVEAGYRELALTGVHSGSYGRDWGRSDALVSLLRQLEEIPGLDRIRLNSVEPGSISDALVEHAAASEKLCRHFHIPLQSGDDHILRRMGRTYTVSQYCERLDRLATSVPDGALGADVMVGFPGEEEGHFRRTCDLVHRLPLTYLHVFTFSARPGTPAERLPDHVTRALKSSRAGELIALGKDKRLAFHRRLVGRVVRVLVEDRRNTPAGLHVGLTDNYTEVLFAGAAATNTFIDARITEAREDLVCGERCIP